jgi:hypothetical protein
MDHWDRERSMGHGNRLGIGPCCESDTSTCQRGQPHNISLDMKDCDSCYLR